MELTWNGKADDEVMIAHINQFCSEVGLAIFGVDREGVLTLIPMDESNYAAGFELKVLPGQPLNTDSFMPRA